MGAILLASIVAGVISLVLNTRLTSQRSSQYARVGALDAAHIIESVDFEALCASDTSELYTRTRSMLRDICQSIELEYLYLYQVSSEEQEIRFVMTVAADDEEDTYVAEKRGLGVVVPRILTEQEQAALSGEQYPEAYVEDNDFGHVYSWFYPVYDDNGSVIALIGSDYDTDRLLWQTVRRTLYIILPLIGILLLVFLIELIVMRRRIFLPIQLISNRMKGFVSDEGANFDSLDIHSEDEMQEIADSFEKMSEDIKEYIGHIEKLTTERVQKNVELEIAGRIQSGIVPAEIRRTGKRCDVYGCARPAKEVGGDFYDCFKNRKGNICVVIGDVSGKGVAAAMFMVMVKTMLRDSLKNDRNPAKALNAVNDALCKSNPEGMFATVFAFVLDSDNGELHYANAGHTRPVLWGAGTEFLEADPGIALGLFEDAGIVDGSVHLKENTGILIYTDGVTETVNPQKEFFGEARLLSALSGAGGAEPTVNTLGDTVQKFAKDAEQFDDYTVLALYYNGGAEQRFNLSPELSSLPELREAILKTVEGSDGRKIYLACEEVFVNIANYSQATETQVLLKRQNDRLTVEFIDNGVLFNPLSVESDGKEFEELDSGGMGLELVKQIADALHYNCQDNKNVLTLEFALAPAEGEQDR
ncbi:MAG: SpoIIE family protein phosphatase [Lachnospiraceae bacterium]|nr:SpoIIE family protein phosphatase [Lachnospiraceae bacterium]